MLFAVAALLFAACGPSDAFPPDQDARPGPRVPAVDGALPRDAANTLPDGALDAQFDAVPGTPPSVADASVDGSRGDAGDAASDAAGDAAPDAARPATTLRLSHRRELRGVWIATVYNINFPSRAGLDAAAQRRELEALLDTATGAGLNAVFFQARPEADAFWPSARSPWSRFLTGTQGQAPGYDPLQALLDAARARALEVHVWLNPYRAAVDADRALHPSHVAARHPEVAYPSRGQLWLDPGSEVVREDAVEVVRELVTRYRVDGVHFDDYFYPYPDDTPFPDDATFAAYQTSGGALDLADWRRENVNALVREVAEVIAEADPDVSFGIAPFGIYRPGQPEGVTGLDQFSALYADPPVWMRAGWVDYLAPQLYWNATRPRQDYEALLRWWSGLSEGGRVVFAGNNLSALGSEPGWSVDEFRRQLGISRAVPGDGPSGNIYFQVDPLVENRDGIRDIFAQELYAAPALTPVLSRRADAAPAAPTLALDASGALQIGHPERERLRAFSVYLPDGAAWRLARVLSADTTTLAVSPGERVAVAAVARSGAESEAALGP